MVQLVLLWYTWFLPPSFSSFAPLIIYCYSPSLNEIPNVILKGKDKHK